MKQINRFKLKFFLLYLLLLTAFIFMLHLSMNSLVDKKQIQKFTWVQHTNEVIVQSKNLLNALIDAETGQRGFLLTRNETYLEPYINGKISANKTFSSLFDLTVDNHNQTLRLKKIRTLMDLKFAELNVTVSDKNFTKALQLVKKNIGQKYMDEIRALIKSLTEEEKRLLRIRKKAYDESSSENIKTLKILISFLFAIMLYFIFVTILRKKERDELLQREKQQNWKLEQYLALIDSYVIRSTTDLSGRITDVSTAFCIISGYSKEELIGKNHNIVRHEDMTNDLYKDLWMTIQSDEVWEGEIKNKTKSGDYYWVHASIAPHYDEKGEKIGYVAIRHLITAQKDLDTTQEVIINQSKLSAMGEMISILAHQWRQPLNLIGVELSKLRLFWDANPKNEKIDHSITKIESTLQNLSDTINEFKHYFDPQVKTYHQTLDELLSSLLPLYQNALNEYEISFIQNLDPSLKTLNVPDTLTQVLSSLIQNSIESLMEKEDQKREISLEVLANDTTMTLLLVDNGVGIEEKNIGKVFEPYFSTKGELNGKGLGLYIARMIINKLDGKISLRNISEGLEVKIVLPKNKS